MKIIKRIEITKGNQMNIYNQMGCKLKIGDVIFKFADEYGYKVGYITRSELKDRLERGIKIDGVKLTSDGKIIMGHESTSETNNRLNALERELKKTLEGVFSFKCIYDKDIKEQFFENDLLDKLIMKHFKDYYNAEDMRSIFYGIIDIIERIERLDRSRPLYDVTTYTNNTCVYTAGYDFNKVLLQAIQDIDDLNGGEELQETIDREVALKYSKVEPYILLDYAYAIDRNRRFDSDPTKNVVENVLKLDAYCRDFRCPGMTLNGELGYTECIPNENMHKALSKIIEKIRAKDKLEDLELLVIQKNIYVLTKYRGLKYTTKGSKANFTRIISDFNKTHNIEIDIKDVQDYLTVIDCIQKLASKKDESIKYNTEQECWEIAKLNLKITVHPFEVTLGRIDNKIL